MRQGFIRHIIVFLAVLILTPSYAQEIRGLVVADETGEPLTGAYVIWEGTSRGAVTDIDGRFSAAKYGTVTRLVASYIGYDNDTIDVAEQSEVTFRMHSASLDEVEVSARRLGQNMNRLSALSTIDIGTSELYKAACCNLGESFETNASVDVNYADAATGAKTIQMLGLQGKYVQMLVENVPNMRLLALPFGLSYVPGAWMDGIQISKGVGTVVNGYEAITGQINIEYKKPTSNQIASANAYTATNGRIEVNADVTQPVGKKASTALMVNAAKDTRTMDMNHDGFRDEPETRQMNLLNRWNYHNNRGYNLHLTVKTLNEERLGGQTRYEGKRTDDDIYGVRIRTNRVETWMKNAFVFNNETNLGIATGYTWHKQRSVFGHRRYDADLHSYNINVIFNRTWNDEMHALHAGVSSQGDFLDETASNIVPDGESMDDIAAGAFAQYTYKLQDKLTIIAGIRADRERAGKGNKWKNWVTPRLHLRYAPTQNTIIRIAAGTGHRTGAALAENNYLMGSSRAWNMIGLYNTEKALNTGINITQYIEIGGRQLTLNGEIYRTAFAEQMLVDYDQSARELSIYSSKRDNRAINVQVEARCEIVRNLEVSGALRYNKTTQYTADKAQDRPLVGLYKGLVTLSYATPLRTWQIDANMQINGDGRVPSTDSNPEELRRADTFDAYNLFNAQITKLFRRWNVYVGCENIGDFTQKDPIIDAENPFGQYFDSSLIWGPLMTRKFYVGMRWSIDRD